MTSKNYFVENNRTTSVMISKDCVNDQELQENSSNGGHYGTDQSESRI